MAKTLSQLLTDAAVRKLAGAQSYQRGRDYFADGHVTSIEERGGNSIHAVVRGNDDYKVTLKAGTRQLDYSCDCPVGEDDGGFCKHCVAAALAWLNRTPDTSSKPSSRRQPKQLTLADAAKIMGAEDSKVLVKLIFDWAKDDDRLRERLILHASRLAGPDSAAAAVRRAL